MVKLHTDIVRRAPRLGSVSEVATDRKATDKGSEYKWWKIVLGQYVCEHGENAYKIEDDGKTISCACENMTYRCRPGETCEHIVAYLKLRSPPTTAPVGELKRLLQDAGMLGDQPQPPAKAEPERTPTPQAETRAERQERYEGMTAEEIVRGMDNAELKRNANNGGLAAIAELKRRADGRVV